jgi:hypothetical protein
VLFRSQPPFEPFPFGPKAESEPPPQYIDIPGWQPGYPLPSNTDAKMLSEEHPTPALRKAPHSVKSELKRLVVDPNKLVASVRAPGNVYDFVTQNDLTEASKAYTEEGVLEQYGGAHGRNRRGAQKGPYENLPSNLAVADYYTSQGARAIADAAAASAMKRAKEPTDFKALQHLTDKGYLWAHRTAGPRPISLEQPGTASASSWCDINKSPIQWVFGNTAIINGAIIVPAPTPPEDILDQIREKNSLYWVQTKLGDRVVTAFYTEHPVDKDSAAPPPPASKELRKQVTESVLQTLRAMVIPGNNTSEVNTLRHAVTQLDYMYVVVPLPEDRGDTYTLKHLYFDKNIVIQSGVPLAPDVVFTAGANMVGFCQTVLVHMLDDSGGSHQSDLARAEAAHGPKPHSSLYALRLLDAFARCWARVTNKEAVIARPASARAAMLSGLSEQHLRFLLDVLVSRLPPCPKTDEYHLHLAQIRNNADTAQPATAVMLQNIASRVTLAKFITCDLLKEMPSIAFDFQLSVLGDLLRELNTTDWQRRTDRVLLTHTEANGWKRAGSDEEMSADDNRYSPLNWNVLLKDFSDLVALCGRHQCDLVLRSLGRRDADGLWVRDSDGKKIRCHDDLVLRCHVPPSLRFDQIVAACESSGLTFQRDGWASQHLREGKRPTMAFCIPTGKTPIAHTRPASHYDNRLDGKGREAAQFLEQPRAAAKAQVVTNALALACEGNPGGTTFSGDSMPKRGKFIILVAPLKAKVGISFPSGALEGRSFERTFMQGDTPSDPPNDANGIQSEHVGWSTAPCVQASLGGYGPTRLVAVVPPFREGDPPIVVCHALHVNTKVRMKAILGFTEIATDHDERVAMASLWDKIGQAVHFNLFDDQARDSDDPTTDAHAQEAKMFLHPFIHYKNGVEMCLPYIPDRIAKRLALSDDRARTRDGSTHAEALFLADSDADGAHAFLINLLARVRIYSTCEPDRIEAAHRGVLVPNPALLPANFDAAPFAIPEHLRAALQAHKDTRPQLPCLLPLVAYTVECIISASPGVSNTRTAIFKEKLCDAKKGSVYETLTEDQKREADRTNQILRQAARHAARPGSLFIKHARFLVNRGHAVETHQTRTDRLMLEDLDKDALLKKVEEPEFLYLLDNMEVPRTVSFMVIAAAKFILGDPLPDHQAAQLNVLVSTAATRTRTRTATATMLMGAWIKPCANFFTIGMWTHAPELPAAAEWARLLVADFYETTWPGADPWLGHDDPHSASVATFMAQQLRVTDEHQRANIISTLRNQDALRAGSTQVYMSNCGTHYELANDVVGCDLHSAAANTVASGGLKRVYGPCTRLTKLAWQTRIAKPAPPADEQPRPKRQRTSSVDTQPAAGPYTRARAKRERDATGPITRARANRQRS